jgi:RNA polymerase sigma-70 factor, ECF subfamily
LLSLFAPDATWTADSGGKVPASPRPLVGADVIVRLLMKIQEKAVRDPIALELISVNRETGIAFRLDRRLLAVLSVETDGDRIVSVYATLNPDKLGAAIPA